jgi:hypothetical protein
MSKASNEQVPFRHILMPCCNTLLCWVNPRRPMYCPECGTKVFHHFPKEAWEANFATAWLRITNHDKGDWFMRE